MNAMAQHEAPQVDLDALQAQINLSMSLTEDLVSSWIRPIAKNLTKPGQSSKTTEKELQDYLRRPPRLGVGAPLPECSGVSERETIKLKHKLSVNDKKRQREEVGRRLDKTTEEDEVFERKGESSSKRMRLDPFSIPGKKKEKTESIPPSESKGKEKVEGASTDEHLTKKLPVNGLSTKHSSLKPNSSGNIYAATSGNTGELSPVAAILPSSKKRKKRKKRAFVTQAEDAGGSNSAGIINPSALTHDCTPETQEPEGEADNTEWSGFGGVVDLNASPPKQGIDRELRDKTPTNTAKTPTISPSSMPTLGLLLSAPGIVPGPRLLNLHGPPPSDTEDAANLIQDGLSSRSKKKRKRNRRKKKHFANDQPSTS